MSHGNATHLPESMDCPPSHAGQTKHNEPKEWVSDKTAEKYDRALADVQQLLKVRGVRSSIVHTHHLKLFGDGRPFPQGKLTRQAPELVVHNSAGRAVATVDIGQRSGCYLVSIPQGRDLETVPSGRPEMVANLVLAAQPSGTA